VDSDRHLGGEPLLLTHLNPLFAGLPPEVVKFVGPAPNQLCVPVAKNLTFPPPAVRPIIAYSDVLAAWKYYLRRYNKGRGVVLIGQSQGTFVLRRLIAEEIDVKAKQRKRVISAILLGGNVLVHAGLDVGGDFQHIKACTSEEQTGCVIAWSTFNATPPANAIFGRATEPAVAAGGDGDDRMPELFHDAQQPQDLVAFAAGGENQDDIVLPDRTQIAVDGVGGTQKMAGSAGGGESRGNLAGNVTGLTDSGGQRSAAAIDDEPHRALEIIVDRTHHSADGVRLRFDHLARELSQG